MDDQIKKKKKISKKIETEPQQQYDQIDYHNTIFAYLNQLQYLDYQLITKEQKDIARDAKLDQLYLLEEEEKIQKKNKILS